MLQRPQSPVKWFGALAALVTFAALLGAAFAQDAQLEPKLVLYASHPTEMVDFFTSRFTEEYGVEVELVYAGTGELLARIGAEAARPQADLMWGGGSDTGASKPELFLPYDSPALEGVTPQYRDEAGYNVPFDAFTMVLLYNKDLVAADAVPQTWADLTDPKWKGKVVHANPATSGSAYAAMVGWLGIGGWELVEALARNQVIAESSSAPFTQVGQGENAIGVAYEEGAFRWLPSGKVGIVYPSDGVLVGTGGLFIVRGGPHPNAARAFADFVIAREQQQALADNFLGRRPTHKDVQLNPAMTPFEELNGIIYPVAEAAARREEYLAQWRQIMLRTR